MSAGPAGPEGPGRADDRGSGAAVLRCSDPSCGREWARESLRYSCPACGGLCELAYPGRPRAGAAWPRLWRSRLPGAGPLDASGVWRFRELLPLFPEGARVVTLGEGATPLVELPGLAARLPAARLAVKQLGANPTGSFKDLGMTVCVSEAVRAGARGVACASTGNTSASMAAYAARAGLRAVVLVPGGAVSGAKLAQAQEFGARVVQVGASFDEAFALLRSAGERLGLYLVNSINPFRLEGQKTAVIELLEQRDWRPPDLVVLPGGNLGNATAIGKGLLELRRAGLIERLPRLAVIQARGAAPFHRLWSTQAPELVPEPEPMTRATAIRIGNPANWPRARSALQMTEGVTEAVGDEEIAGAKRELAAAGVGCEPASAATLAGVRRLVAAGRVEPGADVVLILTGNQLKDPDYIREQLEGRPGIVPAEPTPLGLERALRGWL